MKNYQIYGLLSVLLLLSSCMNDNIGLSGKETHSFTAQIEQESTRTTVNSQNQVLWTEGDEIGIWGDKGSKNAKFSLQTSNGSSATFTGKLENDEQVDFACYPYQEGATTNGNSLTFDLPFKYTYTGNSNAPMIGFAEDDESLFFKHLCGLMKVTVYGAPRNSVRFIVSSDGADRKAIAGTAVVDNVYSENAVLSIKDDENSKYTITYQLAENTTAEALTFFIPLPVGEYERLTVSLINADDKILFQKSISNAHIRRAVLLNMPPLNCDESISCILADQTIQLDRTMEDYIQTISSEENGTNRLTYGLHTPEDILPKQGQVILYSEITEKFPSGFLGKVTQVEETNSGYIIHTEPAALDEAFEQLYLDKTYDLIPEGSEMEPSRLIVSADEDGFICFTQPLSLAKNGLSVNGSSTLGLKLYTHFELNKESNLPPYAFVTLQSKINSDFGFGIHVEKESSNLIDIPIVNLPLNKTPETIIFTPSLDLSFVANVEGSVGFDANVEFSKSTVGTVLYNKGRWEKGANEIKTDGFMNYGMEANGSFTLQGSMFAGLEIGLNLKLFNNDNIKIGIAPKVGLTETASVSMDLSSLEWDAYERFKDSRLDTSLDVNVDVEASANIFKDSDALLKTSIFGLSFFKKSYYFFPLFDEPTINIDEQNKSALVKYDVTRDLIFESAIGMKLYKDGVYSSSTSQKNYIREEEFDNPLQETFNNLTPGTTYTVHPYISYLGLTFDANPETDFMLEEEEEGPQPGSLYAISVNATDITRSSAYLSGLISDISLLEDTDEYGFIYGTSEPLTAGNGTILPVTVIEENGAFAASIGSLMNNTTYYWRAYVRNGDGQYVYGDLKSFVTSDNPQEQKSVRDILIEFYHATGGDNWINNDNWCTDAPMEEWYGIYVFEGKINSINLNRNNLTGYGVLSGLKELFYFQAIGNNLTGLDVSGCEGLTGLDCRENQITSLNLTGCTALNSLDVQYNNLTTLDLSTCYSMKNIDCSYNSLRGELDLSHCPKLTDFYGRKNYLNKVNFSGCSELEFFHCNENQLTGEIDFSGLQHIFTITLYDNQLSLVKAYNCPSLDYIGLSGGNEGARVLTDNTNVRVDF